MPLRRKGPRNTDAIVISSSSDTSEASEDSTPESDPDSLSSHSCFVDHDASARQTWKVNAGSFGMFNSPALMPRNPEKGKKRKRVKECSDYQESLRSRRSNKRRIREVVVEISDEEEAEYQTLFVPDASSPTNTVIVYDEESGHKSHLYSGMTPERVQNTQEYLDVASQVATAENVSGLPSRSSAQ